MRQFIEWVADSFEAFQGQGHGKEDRALKNMFETEVTSCSDMMASTMEKVRKWTNEDES